MISRLFAMPQPHWDWRAAANFMFGGCGGALLLVAAFPGAKLAVHALLLGLVLICAGLGMVWLEIGRPWRAANVLRRPQNSWMTREAYVSIAALVCSTSWLLNNDNRMLWAAGGTGIAFLYCQARILRAATGIPAWREPAIVPLIISTGLAEAYALVVLLSIFFSQPVGQQAFFLAGLVLVRGIAWASYRQRLLQANPAAPLTNVVTHLEAQVLYLGHVLPAALLLTTSISGYWGREGTEIAALAVVITGWHMKFLIVTRLAYRQGYSLGKRPGAHSLRMANAGTALLKTRERNRAI